ncbi:hypothetical protein LZP69_14665 [Shewanella sp. AS1]|uniref:hypothetical protein n=1 Tax=Shewanella sp. AS1 TaxID=2907626 RepID=UPI001F3295FB|nr:hypothetical protein [Shewanella sp. AS1]MCE9680398.1 hypothetical protein [Shewanella sp. AS1]
MMSVKKSRLRLVLIIFLTVGISSCTSNTSNLTCAFVTGAATSDQKIQAQNARPNSRENSKASLTNIINGILDVLAEMINDDDNSRCKED